MGKRGPKPTPTAKLKLAGSWRADRRGEEPRPTGDIGDAPGNLDDEAKRLWAETKQVAFWLTDADEPALLGYVTHRSLWWSALQLLETIEKGTDLYKSQSKILLDFAARWSRESGRLGLSPTERTAVKSPAPAAQTTDDKMFGKT